MLVQGLAPHDLDGYLLQRDRWARGNLAVFTLPESPLRARELSAAAAPLLLRQPARLPGAADAAAAAADAGAGAVDRRAADEDQRRSPSAPLWLPSVLLNLGAGAALGRGYMRIPETAHYELLTMEIYTRALRCVVRPGTTAFKVTPKQGTRRRRLDALRKLHLVALLHRPARPPARCCACSTWPGSGRCPTCRGSPR